MKQLAEFLEVDCSAERIAEIVELCNFENMKKADESFKDAFLGRYTEDGESCIFRKGRV